jgi:hypothetical protein
VVCRERIQGALIHRPLTGPFDDVDILSIGDAIPALQADLGTLMRDDVDQLHINLPSGPMTGWTLTRSPDHRSVVVSFQARHLDTVSPGGTMALIEGEAGPSSWFLPLKETDLAALRDIVGSAWLVRSDEPKRPVKGQTGPGFALLIGSLQVDLRWNLPLDLSEFPFRLTLLRDGWRIDHIYRFRPLVYYAALNSPSIMRQFAVSLRSLITAGGYEGDVAVLTDKSVDEIRALTPPGMKGSLVVLPCDARDVIGCQAARFAITGWRDAWTFQPLLYVDTDILFDLPVGPMLHAITLSERIAATVEPSEYLATSIFVGAALMREDNCDPGSLRGFNSGTLGIPNLARHACTLDLIGRIMNNRATMQGREALPYFDQSVSNYVSVRQANFDIDLISPFVRLSNQVADPANRIGLVHYCWVLGGDYRVDVMLDYLARVDAMDGRTSAPTPVPAPTAPATSATEAPLTSEAVPPLAIAAYSMHPPMDFETVVRALKD